MVHYKLFYFPLRGRVEAIRQLFKLAGVEFEDVQITMEEWPQYKAQMPLGQMPVLEVDGVQIAQSISILRYLGQQFKLSGKNALEAARLDMIAEVVQEMTNKDAYQRWSAILLGEIAGDKDKYFVENVLPLIEETAAIVEKFLMETGNGLLIGDSETWVDVFVAEIFVRSIDFGRPDSLSAYPRILDLIQRIHNIPAIKAHIEKRGDAPC